MSIENESQIPAAEQLKKGMSPEMQEKLDKVDRALSLGSGLIKKWLKDKKGVEFSEEQEAEFDKLYQVSFAFSSLTM